MSPFRIQYFCPLEDRVNWKWLRNGFGFVRSFSDLATAQGEANRLMFRYHTVRVLDAAGIVQYQV